MGKEGVVITVNDDVPSHSSRVANPQFQTYRENLFIASWFFVFVLISFRIIFSEKDTIKFPPHGMIINGVLLIMSAIALCVTLSVTYFLIYANYFRLFPRRKDIHYTILKCVGSCSAIFTICFLVMSSKSPINFIWIAYSYPFSVGCCYYLITYPKHKRKKDIIAGYSGLVLVPLLYVLVIFLPNNLDWIVFTVGFLFFGIETTCLVFNSIKEICKKRKKQYP